MKKTLISLGIFGVIAYLVYLYFTKQVNDDGSAADEESGV